MRLLKTRKLPMYRVCLYYYRGTALLDSGRRGLIFFDGAYASILEYFCVTFWSMKKSSIEKRVNLHPVLIDMQKYSIVTRKFAKVLTGEVQEIGLGYPQRQTAKLYGVTMRTKIVLQRHFALHMDNSGHFTGKKYGKNGHGDKYPLTLEEITNIPKIVKTARAEEIFGMGWQRGAQRFKIARKTSRHQAVVIEISRSKNRINIVTAYNLTASQYKNLTKKSDTLTIESVC